MGFATLPSAALEKTEHAPKPNRDECKARMPVKVTSQAAACFSTWCEFYVCLDSNGVEPCKPTAVKARDHCTLASDPTYKSSQPQVNSTATTVPQGSLPK